jgi:hypothetical protein
MPCARPSGQLRIRVTQFHQLLARGSCRYRKAVSGAARINRRTADSGTTHRQQLVRRPEEDPTLHDGARRNWQRTGPGKAPASGGARWELGANSGE